MWWIILTTIIVAGAALGYSLYQTKAYTSTATLQVQPQSAAGGKSAVAPTQVESDVEVAGGIGVKTLVQKDLHLPTPPKITSTSTGTNDLFGISATAATPALAALEATTASNEFVNYEKQLVQTADQQQILATQHEVTITQIEIKNLNAKIAAIEAKGTPAAPVTAQNNVVFAEDQAELSQLNNTNSQLGTQIVDLEVGARTANGDVLQINPGNKSSTPSSPKTERNVGLGLIVGLILGLILAFVIEAFDDSIRSKEDIERVYPNLPNLGVIPIVDTWKVASAPYLVSVRDPLSHATEAYRSLRTAVEFARMNRSVRSIVVTSSMDFEGKTATVANLAVTFAKAGQRTLVVSADLRRPRMANFFAASDEVGLASIALGIASFDEAVTPSEEVPGLYYLGTGPLPAEPAEFLSSRKVEDIFHALRERFDVILIDTPPAVLVTDALIMSRYVDSVILVVAQGRTRRKSLARVRELCAQVDAPVIGTILNGVATKGADSEAYGYGRSYRYGYGQSRTYGSDASSSGKGSSKRKSVSARPASPALSAVDLESEQTGS